MIDLAKMIYECRRKYGPCRHVFDNGNTTFADIRDMFHEALGTEIQLKPVLDESESDGPYIEFNDVGVRNFVDGPDFITDIDARLEKFIDGLGWKCSLEQYVQDKYSRYIVNAARKYDIDVSRLSEFVRLLAARLSRLASSRPTRQDLTTYAKLDSLPVRHDKYRQMLNDLEAGVDQTNADIIAPIENFILEICLNLMRKIYWILTLDMSPGARQIRNRCGSGRFNLMDYENTRLGIKHFKHDFHCLLDYAKTLSDARIYILKDNRPYQVLCNFGSLDAITELIGKYI